MNAAEGAHLSSCIHGYYVYNAICNVTVRKELQCGREIGNVKDGYTISILQGSNVLGCLLQNILELIQAMAGIFRDMI